MDFLFPMGLDPSIHYEMQVYFGLDGSYFEQYWKFWRGFFEGNMGISLSDRRPVTEIYGERIGNTLRLFISALLFSICIGVPLGIIAAVKRGTILSTVIMSVAFLGYGVPNFIVAIFMILVFSFSLHWFPSSGNTTWMHFVMPVFALGFSMMASEVRFTRSAMLEILGADYIRTAYAKGLKEIIVIGKHEVVFSLRGIGELTVNAAIARDYPLLQFGIVLWAVVVTGVSLIVDLIYGLIDPRIRTVK